MMVPQQPYGQTQMAQMPPQNYGQLAPMMAPQQPMMAGMMNQAATTTTTTNTANQVQMAYGMPMQQPGMMP